MDEILYLEPDEEITSVIDKLKKSESDSVGLVIPRNSTLVHSLVNLKLLKKEAEKAGKDIALVTGDKIGKNIAGQVGLTVFEDVHAKRPVNAMTMPPLPKGDEVIEVDMSNGESGSSKMSKAESGDTPQVKYYQGGASGARSAKNRSTKEAQIEEVIPAPVIDGAEEPEPLAEALTDEISDDELASHAPHRSTIAHQPADTDAGGTDGPTHHRSTTVHTEEMVTAHRPMTLQHHTDHRVSAKSHRTAVSKGRIIFLSLFIVVLLATLLGLPQTSILVTVAAEPFEKTIPLTVDGETESVDGEQAVAPGELVTIENEAAQRVPATGKKDVGGKASGTITFNNAWDGTAQKFPAGTVVTSAEGKTFTIKSDITIPGGTATLSQGQLVTTPGKVNGEIVATEPGEAYNVAAGQFKISGLSGERQAKIYGESSKALTGGFTKQVTVMTQADIDAAKETLVTDLAKEAAEKIRKEAKDKKVIDEAIVSETVSVETNPEKADSETEFFDIKVKTKHQVMVFDEKQMQSLVDAALQQEISEDKELLLTEGDELVVSVAGTDYANNKLNLESKVKTKIGTRVDPVTAKQGLAGKNEEAVKEQLASIPNVKDVSVQTFPSWWWQDLSFAPWNTRLKVVYE